MARRKKVKMKIGQLADALRALNPTPVITMDPPARKSRDVRPDRLMLEITPSAIDGFITSVCSARAQGKSKCSIPCSLRAG